MLSFLCVACGKPCRLPEVQAWIGTEAVCSEVCADQLGEPSDSVEPLDHFQKAIEALGKTEPLVRGAVDNLRKAVAAASMPRMGGGITFARLIGGHLADAHAESEHTKGIGLAQAQLWETEQQLAVCIRNVMALEGLGYSVAATLEPLVSQLDVFAVSLEIAPTATAQRLGSLYHSLGQARAELATEYERAGGSMRLAPFRSMAPEGQASQGAAMSARKRSMPWWTWGVIGLVAVAVPALALTSVLSRVRSGISQATAYATPLQAFQAQDGLWLRHPGYGFELRRPAPDFVEGVGPARLVPEGTSGTTFVRPHTEEFVIVAASEPISDGRESMRGFVDRVCANMRGCIRLPRERNEFWETMDVLAELQNMPVRVRVMFIFRGRTTLPVTVMAPDNNEELAELLGTLRLYRYEPRRHR